MRNLFARLFRFFSPGNEAPLLIRLLPFAVLGVLTLFVLAGSVYAWEYTNSPEFCGTACHTMPPEFTSYLTSPHARIDCVDCHIGRGFIAERVTRKAGDINHIIALAFKDYEFPIRAKELRPARETCERCHFPEKFSDDSLREIKRFTPDEQNTPYSIYLNMHTGGGSAREGLGRGIHWHIENDVRYFALDSHDQEIPYVVVFNEDGTTTEYLDTESGLVPETVDPAYLRQMECTTCHNRITHLISQPADTVDELMSRGAISAEIPEIRRKAVEVFHLDYPDLEAAAAGIADLASYYETAHPETNEALVSDAIAALQQAYVSSVFPLQKANWTSHPDNVGHSDTPGCFRCHDGKHINASQEAIRLECNLCHSIPVVVGPNDFVAKIEISRGPEPGSHLNSNWIGLHRDVFDPSCSNCHTTEDPGGTSDNSFCSNSACHGSAWVFAGFDAPGLRDVLLRQLPDVLAAPEVAGEIPSGAELTYDGFIGAIFASVCGACHGELQGLDLTTYAGAMQGGVSGPAIIAGDPEGSLLIQKQTGDMPHFGQMSLEQLEFVREWITNGAPNE